MNTKSRVVIPLLICLIGALSSRVAAQNLCYVRYVADTGAGPHVHSPETHMATNIFQSVGVYGANDVTVSRATVADIEATVGMINRCLAAHRTVILNAPQGAHITFIGPILYALSLLHPHGAGAIPAWGGAHLYVVSCTLPDLTGVAGTLTRLTTRVIQGGGPHSAFDTDATAGLLATYVAWINHHVEQPAGSAGLLINTIAVPDFGALTARATLLYRSASARQDITAALTPLITNVGNAGIVFHTPPPAMAGEVGTAAGRLPTRVAFAAAEVNFGAYAIYAANRSPGGMVAQSVQLEADAKAWAEHRATGLAAAVTLATADTVDAARLQRGGMTVPHSNAAQITPAGGIAHTPPFTLRGHAANVAADRAVLGAIVQSEAIPVIARGTYAVDFVAAFPNIAWAHNAVFSFGWAHETRQHSTVNPLHAIALVSQKERAKVKANSKSLYSALRRMRTSQATQQLAPQ